MQTTGAMPGNLPGRDYRVDFWRGVALAMIFINHVPGTIFEQFTSRNFGFSDAAELFVFLAGFASAYAYGRLFMAGHRLVAALKAFRRAGVLYLVHATMTVLTVGLFAWAALAFGEGGYMTRIALNSFVTKPLETMIGFASLGHQLGYVNILPMYSALLLMLPLHLALAAIDRRLMLAFAVGLWFLVFPWRIDLPAYPLPGGWFFNPLAWQVIFAAGLYCGLNRIEKGVSVPYRPWLYGAALAFALAAFVTLRFEGWSWWTSLPLPDLLTTFDKTYVGLPRLLHVLAIAYLFANAAADSPFSRITRSNPFTMLGRHSLPVFAVGTMLSLMAQTYKFGTEPYVPRDAVIILGGLAILFALARYLDWWGEASRVVVKSRDPVARSAAGGLATPSIGTARTDLVAAATDPGEADRGMLKPGPATT